MNQPHHHPTKRNIQYKFLSLCFWKSKILCTC